MSLVMTGMYWMGGLFSTYHFIRGVEGFRENDARVIAAHQPPVSDGAILL